MFLNDSEIVCLNVPSFDNIKVNIISLKSCSNTFFDSYRFEISVVSKQCLHVSKLLNQSASLILDKSNYFHGVITSICYQQQDSQGFYYELHIESPLSLLKYSNKPHVFTDQSVIEIIESIFKRHSKLSASYQLTLRKCYQKEPMVVQYQESDYQFFRRLLISHQLFFIWKQSENSMQLIVADSNDCFSNKSIKMLYFPSTQTLANGLSTIQKLEVNNNKINIMTNSLHLQLGQKVKINSDEKLLKNQIFRVNEVNYSVSQNGIINNSAVLVNNSERFSEKKNQSIYHGLHYSFINHSEELDILDAKGRYTIQYLFAGGSISKRIYHAGKFSGVNYGHHFRFYSGTEVLAVPCNGSINQPVVFGVLNNSMARNPVVTLNAYQLAVVSYSGHRIEFSDKKISPSIVLKSADKQLCLHFQGGNHSSVLLRNDAGNILIKAGRRSQKRIDNSLKVDANNYHVSAQRESIVKTEKGVIQYMASKQFYVNAQNQCDIVTKSSAYWQANSINCFAKNQVNIHSNSQLSCCGNSSINLKIGQTITLQSSIIHFKVGNSKMIIDHGSLMLQGDNIQIISY